MKTLKSLLLVAFVTMTVCISASADETNITNLTSEAEFNAYMTNEVVFTTTIRAGGAGAADELIADIDDGFPDTESDITWVSGVSYDFSFDYTLSGSADLSVTLPGDVEESVSKSPTTWFNTVLIGVFTPGFVTFDVTDLTINGESVADISLAPFGGFGGYVIELPGNSETNVNVFNISGSFTPTYSAPPISDDFRIELNLVQQGNITTNTVGEGDTSIVSLFELMDNGDTHMIVDVTEEEGSSGDWYIEMSTNLLEDSWTELNSVSVDDGVIDLIMSSSDSDSSVVFYRLVRRPEQTN